MATRLFWRYVFPGDPSPVYYPTSLEKSTALPTGTFNVDINNEFFLKTQKSTTSDVANQVSSLAQTATQSSTFGFRFSSTLLAAQTISANTWTIFYKAQESNTNANTFLAMSIYVWRPNTSSVVGFIYDSTASLGAEFGTTASTQSITVSGSAVTANRGDILVCEPWYAATQAKATSYTNTLYFDGTDETTTGTGNSSCAAYIETPQNLVFTAPKANAIFIM